VEHAGALDLADLAAVARARVAHLLPDCQSSFVRRLCRDRQFPAVGMKEVTSW
jgi:hypothetical protein